MKRPNPLETDEQQQSPKKVRGGRKSRAQYVSLHLVSKGVTGLSRREIVKELKVNSNTLTKCSKYFKVCLSQRWANSNSPAPSVEFDLEMIHGLQVESYIDCFSRMDNLLRKGFKDVKSSLELLLVASQIEFGELISSIFKYLSTVCWSVKDELRIRQYLSSPDFCSSHAQDLIARLELGQSPTRNQKRISDLIRLYISTALQRDGCSGKNVASSRSWISNLFWSISLSETTAFDTNMVMIFSNEAKEMLEHFYKECTTGEAYDPDQKQLKDVYQVPGFVHKLEAVCWILKMLVKANVAGEVIEYFLLLEMFPKILACAAHGACHPPFITFKKVILKFLKRMCCIHKEVVAGNVELGIPARVALLERWRLTELFPEPIWRDAIYDWDYEQAVEDVLSTLPFGWQIRLVRPQSSDCSGFINAFALTNLVKRKWEAAEEDQRLLKAEEESEAEEKLDIEGSSG